MYSSWSRGYRGGQHAVLHSCCSLGRKGKIRHEHAQKKRLGVRNQEKQCNRAYRRERIRSGAWEVSVEMALEDGRSLDWQRWSAGTRECFSGCSQGSDLKTGWRWGLVQLSWTWGGHGSSEDFSFARKDGVFLPDLLQADAEVFFYLVFVLRLPLPGSYNVWTISLPNMSSFPSLHLLWASVPSERQIILFWLGIWHSDLSANFYTKKEK